MIRRLLLASSSSLNSFRRHRCAVFGNHMVLQSGLPLRVRGMV